MYIDLIDDFYTIHSDFSEIAFPDGQPHFEFREVWGDLEPRSVQIHTRLASGNDIFRLMCLLDCMANAGHTEAILKISYLTGARMDRRINNGTLTPNVVAAILGTSRVKLDISIFVPHSDVCLAALDASPISMLPLLRAHLVNTPPVRNLDDVALVAPDAGAAKRVEALGAEVRLPVVQGSKHRDPSTGKLSGFGVGVDVVPSYCIIVDDLCDGGGTFEGLAAVLRERGAKRVDLVVAHGIFSNPMKGPYLDGIDRITTTNSFRDIEGDGLFVVNVQSLY